MALKKTELDAEEYKLDAEEYIRKYVLWRTQLPLSYDMNFLFIPCWAEVSRLKFVFLHASSVGLSETEVLHPEPH